MIGYPRILALHKETEKSPNISPDPEDWPKSWKTVEYKEYRRLQSFKLPKPEALEKSLSEILSSRVSGRTFVKEKEVSLQELSNFLYWTVGQKNEYLKREKIYRRMYPSGGARYPLEIYFAFVGNNQVPKGVYHYNVRRHIIERLAGEKSFDLLKSLPTYPFARDAQLTFFISGFFERNMRKYKERGYRFVNLEAGIVLENFYLVATSLGLGVCGLGVPNDEEVQNILDLDIKKEFILTCCVVGK